MATFTRGNNNNNNNNNDNEEEEEEEEEEEDDFFGSNTDDDDDKNDNHDDYGLLARHEDNAIATQLQNVAYLDAFDEYKESRLQDGFEAGYREVFTIASRLGELLGIMTARARIHSLVVNETTTTTSSSPQGNNNKLLAGHDAISRKFRAVMDQINKGDETSDIATKMLLDLETEVKLLLRVTEDS